MSEFSFSYKFDPHQLYRPKTAVKSNPRKWWRYAILSVLQQNRCKNRDILWKSVSKRNSFICENIKTALKHSIPIEDLDLSIENIVQDRAEIKQIKEYQRSVEDLQKENEALRKMVESLLSPSVKKVASGIDLHSITSLPGSKLNLTGDLTASLDHRDSFSVVSELDLSPRSPSVKSLVSDKGETTQEVKSEKISTKTSEDFLPTVSSTPEKAKPTTKKKKKKELSPDKTFRSTAPEDMSLRSSMNSSSSTVGSKFSLLSNNRSEEPKPEPYINSPYENKFPPIKSKQKSPNPTQQPNRNYEITSKSPPPAAQGFETVQERSKKRKEEQEKKKMIKNKITAKEVTNNKIHSNGHESQHDLQFHPTHTVPAKPTPSPYNENQVPLKWRSPRSHTSHPGGPSKTKDEKEGDDIPDNFSLGSQVSLNTHEAKEVDHTTNELSNGDDGAKTGEMNLLPIQEGVGPPSGVDNSRSFPGVDSSSPRTRLLTNRFTLPKSMGERTTNIFIAGVTDAPSQTERSQSVRLAPEVTANMKRSEKVAMSIIRRVREKEKRDRNNMSKLLSQQEMKLLNSPFAKPLVVSPRFHSEAAVHSPRSQTSVSSAKDKKSPLKQRKVRAYKNISVPSVVKAEVDTPVTSTPADPRVIYHDDVMSVGSVLSNDVVSEKQENALEVDESEKITTDQRENFFGLLTPGIQNPSESDDSGLNNITVISSNKDKPVFNEKPTTETDTLEEEKKTEKPEHTIRETNLTNKTSQAEETKDNEEAMDCTEESCKTHITNQTISNAMPEANTSWDDGESNSVISMADLQARTNIDMSSIKIVK